MDIIFSYWDCNSEQFFSQKMAYLSNKSFQKNGYRTYLYTENKSIDKFKMIPFDEIKIFDSKILNKAPKNMWAFGKMLAYFLHDKPFCHVDFDFFLSKQNRNLDILENKPFFTYCKELWMCNSIPFMYPEVVNKIKLFDEIKQFYSYNCAIFGGSDLNSIKFNAEKIIKYLIDNREYISSIKTKEKWYTPVIFEQIIFINLLKQMLKIKVPTFFDKCYTIPSVRKKELEYNVIHLSNHKKKIIMENF